MTQRDRMRKISGHLDEALANIPETLRRQAATPPEVKV